MRALVLILAILLLPLRGWLGDAMATNMAAGMAHQAAVPAAMSQASTSPMPAHMAHVAIEAGAHTAAHVASDAASHDHTTPPDCQSTCTDCQLCHSVAVALCLTVAPTHDAPRTAPGFVPVTFASAPPAPGFKPPIS